MNEEQLKIGTDPELGFVDKNTNQQMLAEKILPQSSIGIGLDGHRHIGEVRTLPDFDPILHSLHLRDMILLTARDSWFVKNRHIEFRAGSMITDCDPLGGHIHLPIKVVNGRNTPSTTIKNIVSILDLFLSIPVLMICDRKSAAKRINSTVYGDYPYGRISHYKIKNYRSGEASLEYRSLPSWLVSLGFTKSILALAYVVSCEINDLSKGKRGDIPKLSNIEGDPVDRYNRVDKDFFWPYIIPIYEEVTKMRLFPKYNKEISSLFGLIRTFYPEGKDWEENRNIIPRWNIDENDIKGKYRFYYENQKDEGILKDKLTCLRDDYEITEKILIYIIRGNTRIQTDYFNGMYSECNPRKYEKFYVLAHPYLPNKYYDYCTWGVKQRYDDKDYGFNRLLGITENALKSDSKCGYINSVIDGLLEYIRK